MIARAQRYDWLATLLDYPGEGGYAEQLDRCVAALGEGYADEAALLQPLRDQVAEMTPEQIQEMYTRTFDINPVCTLEVGWHIYGEDYARGALLVRLRQELRERNLPESTELPDHLTHVLALLGRLDGDQADDLAARYLLPALDKMLAGMKDTASPYLPLLETIARLVRKDHDVEVLPPRERRSDPPGWKNSLPVFGQGCSGAPGGAGCGVGPNGRSGEENKP